MRNLLLLTLISTLICLPLSASQKPATPTPTQTAQATPTPAPTPAPLPPPTISIDNYREPAGRIIGAALVSDHAYKRLGYLTDEIGHRLSGSKNLERAIEWAIAEMKRDGLDNVRGEKVMVPYWVRGAESLEMITPRPMKLTMLGIGDSVATPANGITAETVVVRSFAELDKLGEGARGKIVVYNAPFTTYGETVYYRGLGAARAARYGAVAALVRSVTPVSLQTAHTGIQLYDPQVPKIPAAAITIEGAELLQRMQERGTRVTVRLKMEAKFLPDAESANVIGELRGTEKPDEIVLISGHIDSWDVGQGAQDDGGGIMIAWEAARLLKQLGLRPRRTIRVVLYTNEENGVAGGNAYRDTHLAQLAKHIFAIESDIGTYRPKGLGLASTAPPQARSNLQEIAKLLAGIGANTIGPTNGGTTDIEPIMTKGVLGAGLDVDNTHYFDIHHTNADTLDKVNPRDLQYCIATMAVFAYVIADLPEPFKQP